MAPILNIYRHSFTFVVRTRPTVGVQVKFFTLERYGNQ